MIIIIISMIVINVIYFQLDKRTPRHHGDWASSPFSHPELLAYLILFPSYVINLFLLL